MYKILTN